MQRITVSNGQTTSRSPRYRVPVSPRGMQCALFMRDAIAPVTIQPQSYSAHTHTLCSVAKDTEKIKPFASRELLAGFGEH